MKKLLFILLLLFPCIAQAALNSATNWELRGTGNDTNGGAYTLGVSVNSSKNDLAVDASNNLQVTSAGYGFTSVDVGRWIQVTAGTGWTTGYYKISAVAAGKATLNLSPAPTSTTSGSFSIYWGLDYSQQDAKNANGGSDGSSVLAAATGTTTITCSDCSLTHDIIGNVVYFSGGTGSIAAQRRAVTGWTNSTTMTIDTAIAASTGMTLNIGGALATMDETLGARGMIASNVVWWKHGTDISTSSALTSTVGGSIFGYNSTRGDLNGVIGSSNRPKLTFSGTSAFAMTMSTATWRLRNFVIDASSGAGASGLKANASTDFLYNITVKNYDTTGIQVGGAQSVCEYCEATGGTTNALEGILMSSSAALIASYIHDGNGPGILTGSQSYLFNNIVSNQAGATADGIVLTTPANSPPIVVGNTVYNSGRHGINMTGTSQTPIMYDNILVNNAGFGIVFSSAQAASPFYDGNAFYNNTSGARSNMDALTQAGSNFAYTNINDVTLSGVPFVSAGTGNFGLNATSGQGGALRDAGLPRAWPGSISAGYPDIGAVYHQDPGTITVNANCGF